MVDDPVRSNLAIGFPPPGRTLTEPAGSPDRTACRRLDWALKTYGDSLLLITAGSRAGLVLAHLVWSIGPTLEVALLDTGLGFPERQRAVRHLAGSVGGRLTILRPDLSVGEQEALYGPDLWSRAPGLCCFLRQVAVLARILAGRPAWLAAGSGRAHAAPPDDFVAQDPPFGLPRVEPIYDWTEKQIDGYLRRHRLPGADLPIGEPSGLACSPCTRIHQGPAGRQRVSVEPGRVLVP